MKPLCRMLSIGHNGGALITCGGCWSSPSNISIQKKDVHERVFQKPLPLQTEFEHCTDL